MAPTSARRQSARKRQPSARQRGQNAPASSSPSRPAKRRKKIAPPPPADTEPEPMEEGADEETSDDEQLNALSEAADKVVEVLSEPQAVSNVAKEHGNENNPVVNSSISAYAKIAGRTWTYYVRDPTIYIGRRPDGKHPSDGKDPPTHIDLGPSKHVSRLHGTVFYESADECWYVEVGGRNGIRVDEALLRKGDKMALHSGNVLRIDDTEMIFVLPGVQSVVDEQYLTRLRHAPKVEEDGDGVSLPQNLPMPQKFHQPAHISPYAVPNVNGHGPSDGPSSSSQRQTTPNPIMQAPYLSQNATGAAQPSSTPQKGPPMVLENSDQHVDYSDESMKDVKPPMSYATLIAQAILAGPNEKSSLNGIYEWIKSNFAYYRYLEAGWQNSIRHNLSLNQAFHRVGRDTHEPGKGGLWYIAEDRIEEFRKQGLKMTSRGGARQSSNPSSPAPKKSPKKKTPPRKAAQAATLASLNAGAAAENDGAKVNTDDPNQATESQTPLPKPGKALVDGPDRLPQLSSDASPLPARPAYLSRSVRAGGSPPTTLTSGGLFNRDDAEFGSSSLLTPAPQRHEPRITAPSTAKLPSKYLPQSSPAPFWKNIGATPMPLPETSPAKADSDTAPADVAREDSDQTRLLQSSSPPPPSANGSPTRVRSKVESAGLSIAGTASRPPLQASSLRPSTPPQMSLPIPAAASNAEDEDEDDEEEQLDLMGNFPKIGEHALSNAAAR